jgi:hypothetical protein
MQSLSQVFVRLRSEFQNLVAQKGPEIQRWAVVALILGTTGLLVVVKNVEPHEWVTEVAFIGAHLLAAHSLKK